MDAMKVVQLRDAYVAIVGAQPPSAVKKKADIITAINAFHTNQKNTLLQQIDAACEAIDRMVS